MKISAVIVMYNPNDYMIKNINNYIDAVDKLYIIDNSDDKITRFKSEKKIEYIKMPSNKGVAYALNIGAKHAIKDKYKYLLTLDQDSKIQSNHIKKMIDYISKYKEKNLGLVSPYHKLKYSEETPNASIEERIEVMTSGNIINLDAYNKVGGFKDWLFIDCVDTDFCMNLNQNGFKVYRLNNIQMPHDLGNMKIHKFFGKQYISYNHNPLRMYYITRNNLYISSIYKKIYPEYCKWLIKCLRSQKKRIILFEKNKIKKLLMMKKGLNHYKKGIKGKLS